MAGNAEAFTAEKGFREPSAEVSVNAQTKGALKEDTGDVSLMESKDTSDNKAVKNTEDIKKDTYEKVQNGTSSFFTEVTESGKLRFTMRNDYMFKAVFQQNGEALKALLASLLARKIPEIKEVRLENPIILGETVEDKTVILDIRVLLNNEECINIEMQVAKQIFWKERTLVYVSRNFSDLNRGEEYDKVKPVIHIGILDFRLDEDDRSFYSEYILTDRKTGEVYSEKLRVNVLSLKNIGNAAKEHRESGLYDWARFFAAATWEDLRMAAMDSSVMQSAVVTMRNLTANDKVRLQCEARERYNLDLRTWQSALRREKAGREAAEADKQKAEADKQKAEADKQKAEADKQKAEADKQKAEADKQKAEADKQKAEDALNVMYELMRQNPELSAADILDKMKSE